CGNTNSNGSCGTCGNAKRQDLNPMLRLLNNGNYSGQVGGNVYNVHGPMSVVDHRMVSMPEEESDVQYNPRQLPPHVEEPEEPGFWEGFKEFCSRMMYGLGVMTLILGLLIMTSIFLFFIWVIYSAYSHAQAVSSIEAASQV